MAGPFSIAFCMFTRGYIVYSILFIVNQGKLTQLMWLKQCYVYHPPVITIPIGGMFTIPKWVVYGIVLTKLWKITTFDG